MLLEKCSPNVARSLSFVVSSILCLCAGSLYGFSAFSENFAKTIAYLNHEKSVNIEIVGSMGDLGLYLGIIGGMWYDRFGSQWTAIYSAVLGTAGFSLVGLTLQGLLYPKIWILCVYFFLIGQASYCMYLNAVSSTLKSFPKEHKGKITGYFLALYGLSSVVYILIYEHLLHYDVAYLFLVFTLCTAFTNVIALFVVGAVPQEEIEVIGISENEPGVNDPILDKEVDITGIELLKTPAFWIVFLCFLLGTGVGLLWKNILGSMNASFGLKQAPTMVIAWSLVNTAARIMMGIFGDMFASRVPRPLWLVPWLFAIVASASAYFWITDSTVLATLWATNIAVGIGYGAVFSLCSCLTAIYFGTASVGKNFGIITLAPAIGGTVFNAIASALVGLHESPCLGSKCYLETFYFFVPMAALSTIFGILLTILHVKVHPGK